MAGERFEWALRIMRAGKRVRRAAWSPDASVRMAVRPDMSEAVTFLRLEIAGGKHGIDWRPSGRDLHETDWELVEEE